MALFQTQNLITSAFLAFARKSRKEKFEHFPSKEQIFFFSLEDTVKVISRLVELT